MKFYDGETNIICSNLENSLGFYRDILGFELIEKDSEALRLKCGNSYYLLLPLAKQKKERSPYCSIAEFSIDLKVDDLKQAIQYLKENQVEFENDPAADDLFIVIRDPDGMVIEVIQKI